jgi:hypothetical protein
MLGAYGIGATIFTGVPQTVLAVCVIAA